MNLNDIKTGAAILIDANILIYALQKSSRQCEQLVDRCTDDEIFGIVPLHILAEVMHRLMITEAKDNNWVAGSNPTRRLSEQPNRIRSLIRYESSVRDLLALGFLMEPVIQQDFFTALQIQRQAGLLTNDALLAAVAERLRVMSIASADQSFSQAQGITLYSPDDIEP